MEPSVGVSPDERADSMQVARDAEAVKEMRIIENVTGVIPVGLMILNRQRQIVYRNRRVAEMFPEPQDIPPLGKRPGEALCCIHAHEPPFGCGTTEFCKECGGAKAILRSQREQTEAEEECRVTTESGAAYDLRVRAAPYCAAGRPFTIFCLTDISDEKRRQVLEQTFFHDVSNALAVINGYSGLLDGTEDRHTLDDAVAGLRFASRKLMAEVVCHRALLRAERGLFAPNMEPVETAELIGDLLWMAVRQWPARKIAAEPGYSRVRLQTDRTLLFRILYNMIKNAVEACGPADAVTVRCRQAEGECVVSVHNPGVIPQPVQKQVFQRSFSTKGTGRGIGTYSMKLFGEKYLKGRVGFVSSAAEGTVFYISLPA